MSNRFGSLKTRALMTSSAAVLSAALASTFGSAAWAQNASTTAAPASQQIAVTGSTIVLSDSNSKTLAPVVSLGSAPPAQANAQPPAAPTQEIVVTGSRIVRRDYTSSSPIVTLNSQTFENSSSASLETNLNKLPQFTAAVQSQFTAQDVQNTVTNTPGSANVSLRGLGPNRNLVLIDGRRAMPTNGAMLVDINTIPAAMIDRVEVITGGASAVYGADAISGVVNFILKKNYEGATFDAQYGETELGDDKEFRASALIGGNFGDDKGNATLALEHYTRGDAPQANRDFYKKGWLDPTTAGSDSWPLDTYYGPGLGGPTLPDQTVVNNIFGAGAGVLNSSLFMINQASGTLYTGMPEFGGNGFDCTGGASRYTGPTGYKIVPVNHLDGCGLFNRGFQAFKVNVIDESVSTPLTRYSAYGTAHYDINDWLTAFGQATFTQSRTTTVLALSPAVNGWGVLIPHGSGIYKNSFVDTNGNGVHDAGEPMAAGYGPGGAFGLNCANAEYCTNSEVFPTPPELTQLLDSRGAGAADSPWAMYRNLNFLPERGTDNSNTTWNVVMGFDGKIPGTDWTWELFASHGRSVEETLYTGFGSLEGYRAIVLSPNYGKNAKLSGNSNPATNPGASGFAGGLANCTSGLPIFGTTPITQDCIQAITADLQNLTDMEQNVVEFDMQGGLFQNWAGDVRYSLGASYRDNTYRYHQDNLDTQNDALNSTIGLFPSNNTAGSTDAQEGYGEILFPLLSNLPLVKELHFEGGLRYSDYNTVGSVYTYKMLGDWTVFDWLRLRGGFNRATRAPNIGELFQAKAQQVAFATFSDPCSQNPSSPVPFGANAAGAQGVAAKNICAALMGAGAAGYYAVAPALQPSAGAGLALPNLVGNPNLSAETAKTLTMGIVLKSPFDIALLNRASLSVDWYDIKLSNLITAESQDQVYQNCLSLASNPTSDPTIAPCVAIVRDKVTGGVSTVNTSYVNAGGFRTRGIDVQFDWGADLADMFGTLPGALSLNVLYNYLDSMSVQPVKGGPSTQFVGTLGPNTGGLNAPAFRYKVYTTLGYSVGPASVSLRWRHLPSLKPLPGSAPTLVGPGDYDQFDLSANYTVGDHLSLRAGIDNLLDRDPEITGKNTSPVVGTGTSGQGLTLPGIYDVLGRRFYIGATLKY